MARKIIVAYVPVLHRGYLKLLERHHDADYLFLLGPELLAEFDHMRKDDRAFEPKLMAEAIASIWKHRVFVAEPATLENIRTATPPFEIVMPDEEECRSIAVKHLADCTVEFDRTVFLRWDRTTALAEEPVQAGRVIPAVGLIAETMRLAFAEAEKATNLWRRVGAVIARDGEILLTAHNTQVPSPRTPYYEGDPRMFFKQGLHFEITTDDHAERRLIAEAARRGIALEGSDLFVTTFPCPPCGKQVAHAGFRRCYFTEGYAVLDSERILRDAGVEIIQVEMKNPDA